MSWRTDHIGPEPFLSLDNSGGGELVLFLHGATAGSAT